MLIYYRPRVFLKYRYGTYFLTLPFPFFTSLLNQIFKSCKPEDGGVLKLQYNTRIDKQEDGVISPRDSTGTMYRRLRNYAPIATLQNTFLTLPNTQKSAQVEKQVNGRKISCPDIFTGSALTLSFGSGRILHFPTKNNSGQLRTAS